MTDTISGLSKASAFLLNAKANLNAKPMAASSQGITFAEITDKLNEGMDDTEKKDEVWVAAAFYGQARFNTAQLQKIFDILEITSASDQSSIQSQICNDWPQRGLGPVPPTDPVLYRLFEGVMVYGQAIKAVIHEKFGDGIMSMIDCKVTITKKEDPKGDRVQLLFDGKFLPYSTW